MFARNLYLQGNLTSRDFQTYQTLYHTLAEFLPPPDLVIYLRASVPTLLKRITQRDRDYERTISPDYLRQLNGLYEDWINNFTPVPGAHRASRRSGLCCPFQAFFPDCRQGEREADGQRSGCLQRG